MGSDVDVLVIIEGMTRADERSVAEIDTELLVETGRALSVQMISGEEFDSLVQREVGFALDVVREGISA